MDTKRGERRVGLTGRLGLTYTHLILCIRWLSGKESVCNAGDPGLIPGLGRSPGGGHSNPLQYSSLENPHGQRSLVGYSPWGCTELDTPK